MTAIRTHLAIAALCLAVLAAQPLAAEASGFEVVHAEVSRGWIEVESVNGVVLGKVAPGEERSAHEAAISYGLTDFWKLGVAMEVENARGEQPEIHGGSISSLLLLPLGHGHNELGHGHGHGAFRAGLYGALEIPRATGIDDAMLTVGPVWELALGRARFVGNLFVEFPFDQAEDPGLAYAAQLSLPVLDGLAIGLEAHGAFEALFGNAPPLSQQEHHVGPALYFDWELAGGNVVLEPRVAMLFGLTRGATDAVLSFNVEYKFAGNLIQHRGRR